MSLKDKVEVIGNLETCISIPTKKYLYPEIFYPTTST